MMGALVFCSRPEKNHPRKKKLPLRVTRDTKAAHDPPFSRPVSHHTAPDAHVHCDSCHWRFQATPRSGRWACEVLASCCSGCVVASAIVQPVVCSTCKAACIAPCPLRSVLCGRLCQPKELMAEPISNPCHGDQVMWLGGSVHLRAACGRAGCAAVPLKAPGSDDRRTRGASAAWPSPAASSRGGVVQGMPACGRRAAHQLPNSCHRPSVNTIHAASP